MKKILCTVLALCLLAALLPVMAVPAQAASVPVESCLQWTRLYYVDEEVLDKNLYPSVLVKSGQDNIVITALAPKDGCITAFYNMVTDSWYGTEYVGKMSGGFYLYKADSSFGEKEGFLPAGTVTQNEAIRYVVYDCNWEPEIIHTVAVDYDNGEIIPQESINTAYTVAVVNSNDEVCGIEFKGVCYAFDLTDEDIFFGGQGSDEPEPTEPPATEPPATEPPATEPDDQETDLMLDAEYAVELKDLDDIYENAVAQKKDSEYGAIAIAGIGALIVVLVVAVILVKNRKQKKVDKQIDDAEEGTVLVRETDTGVRLQFRNGKRIAVKRALTIGRSPDNDVAIPATSTAVSGHHCEILVQNGAVYLRDLGSTNGTYINGKRLVTGQLVQLLPGMAVSLGTPNGPEGFSVDISRS